jgi:4-hydroxybutyryl-CoA dehydratase/vinylacetyl-CoA-Delta-isomerase
MKNGQEYIESLRKPQAGRLYPREKVDSVSSSGFQPHVNCAALTYELAMRPEYQELLSARSPFINDRVNRWNTHPREQEDLVKKVKALRFLGQKNGGLFSAMRGLGCPERCLFVTWEIDRDKGTDYHARFLKYLREVQRMT